MVEENTAECVVEPEEAYYGGDADEGADDDDDEDDDDDDVDTDDDADFFRHTTILICSLHPHRLLHHRRHRHPHPHPHPCSHLHKSQPQPPVEPQLPVLHTKMDLHQRERVLNSTNHQQRLSAYEAWSKAYEERRVKWLEEHNITEEELLEAGYVRKRRRGHSEEDYYMACWSCSGEEIKAFSYPKDRYIEDERMLDIAENLAPTLGVNVNDIALTTEFCADSGVCTVKVTVLGTTPTSSGP